MRLRLTGFWQDERGTLTADWVFVAAILVLGAFSGAAAVRQSILQERGATFQSAPGWK